MRAHTYTHTHTHTHRHTDTHTHTHTQTHTMEFKTGSVRSEKGEKLQKNIRNQMPTVSKW